VAFCGSRKKLKCLTSFSRFHAKTWPKRKNKSDPYFDPKIEATLL
jgi:hypothetical protein